MQTPFTDFVAPDQERVESFSNEPMFETPLLDPVEGFIPILPFPLSPAVQRSRWHQYIHGTSPCESVPLVHGEETFRSIVNAIRSTSGDGHYIYILGWMINVYFEMIPGDARSKLIDLLQEKASKGVEIRILVWDNLMYSGSQMLVAQSIINAFPNTQLCIDSSTFGSKKVKDALQEARRIVADAPGILDRVDKWQELKAFLARVDNEGSHHEKVVIVKGRGEHGQDELVGFCGGIDINPNRLEDRTNAISQTLHDIHCRVKGNAAWELLQRFKIRWDVFKETLPVNEAGKYRLLNQRLRGASEPKPTQASSTSPGTTHVKIIQTYNHPTRSIQNRSVRETVRVAIANAKRNIHIEDQYMISLEIASWLNAKLKEPNFKGVSILTQDDSYASEIQFPKHMRRRFIKYLTNGLSQTAIDRKVFINMLHPYVPAKHHHRVHSKIYIIDDELAIIGSANCSSRSMTHDSETAAVFFNDPDSRYNFVKELRHKMNNDGKQYPVKYVPNKGFQDIDVKILMASAMVGTSLSVISPFGFGGPSIPLAVYDLIRRIKPFVIDVIDPDADGTVPQQEVLEETGLEQETLEAEFQDQFDQVPVTMETSQDAEIAATMENQVAAVTGTSSAKPCEGHVCWAKEALSKVLGVNLSAGNVIDAPTKQAILDFQSRNNLSSSGKLDPPTERCLLEAEALLRHKATINEPATIAAIQAAKTKIEDWTAKAVVDKPEITNSNRDPRKLWALVLHHMAFKRKSRQTGQYSDPNSYLKTGAHFCIMLDGRIVQLHAFSRMIWHSNCTSPRSVGVEFEGNFPNIKGGWWIDRKSTVQNKDRPTQAQYDSGRFLATYLKLVLGTKTILAHRQSSKDRENDPGPDIWFNVGQWAVDNLALSDGGTGFKCGTGNAILPEWRNWGKKTVNEDFENSMDYEGEEENRSEEENIMDYPVTESFEHTDSVEDSYEFSGEEEVINISRAVELNRKYAASLGWEQYRQQINDLVLPFSDYPDTSLTDESFARAVARWQSNNGFSETDADGIIGPNTWVRIRSQLAASQPALPSDQAAGEEPSASNPFEFNRWHAQKVLDSMSQGIIGTAFNSREQLQQISNGDRVKQVDPRQQIIRILPVISHIADQARAEGYREIIIGSFIRDPKSNGKCTGHCAGNCIDINHTGKDFGKPGAVQMVNRIFRYLLSLPQHYKSSIGFGLPLQGEFFGNQNLELFKGDRRALLGNAELRQLAGQLGIVFPDNPNHLHIQVNWKLTQHELEDQSAETTLAMEDEFADSETLDNEYQPELEQFTRAYKLNKIADYAYLLGFRVPDEITTKLKTRNMYVQYAHNESYSNDLNADFYRLRIYKYPSLNGVQLTAQSLVKYIRHNINSLVDTSYSDFHPYDRIVDKPVWESDDPTGAVLKIDIKGPDNAAVVVSLARPNGWRFSTVTTPDSGRHPVSGHREFFIGRDSHTKGIYFVIKGLDMASTGVAGMGFPIAGEWGFGQAHKLWLSMQDKIVKFINANGGHAVKDMVYSERVEWRYVYYRYRNLIEKTFGKGAGSAENSPFISFEDPLTPQGDAYETVQ